MNGPTVRSKRFQFFISISSVDIYLEIKSLECAWTKPNGQDLCGGVITQTGSMFCGPYFRKWNERSGAPPRGAEPLSFSSRTPFTKDLSRKFNHKWI